MKDVSIVGHYDSLVVYADHSAVDFFALHGFSDDIVLNSKYSDLADNWTNCTLMSYIPPFVGRLLPVYSCVQDTFIFESLLLIITILIIHVEVLWISG